MCVCSIGRNIKHLIERPDGEYCFRLQKDRVYYLSEKVMKAATNVQKDNLVPLLAAAWPISSLPSPRSFPSTFLAS